MRIESINKIYRKDIPEAPSWLDKLLFPLNQFMDSVSTAMRGKLTFGDNFLCEIKEYEFEHGLEQKISYGLKSCIGVMVIKVPDSTDTSIVMSSYQVRTIDNSTLGITFNFAGGAGKKGTIKFLILG